MPKMNLRQFREWLDSQPGDRRYELADGEPVAMAPERVAHARVKANTWDQLKTQIRDQRLPCEAIIDGITVEIGDDISYEPDVLVNCGERLPPTATSAPSPVIVVEVLSPSTRGRDAGAKLVGYFQLPSIVHYVMIDAERTVAIHHRRQDDGTILTRILHGGRLELDPPGLTLDIAALYLD